MNWYYIIGPAHTRVRVFMNGAKCGDLCFRNDEFQEVRAKCLRASPSSPVSSFIDETPEVPAED